MSTKKEDEEEIEDATKSFKENKARTAFLVAIIGAAMTGAAAIIVPIGQSYIVSRQSSARPNVEEVLKALKDKTEQQEKEIKQLREDVIDLRSWTKGYLMAAEGLHIKDPPDQDLPPTPLVEIRPKPKSARRSPLYQAPVVDTPLPFPKALGSSREIPYPVAPSE